MSINEKNTKVDLDEFIVTGKQKTSNTDDLYKNNLEALGKNHPDLVELMESVKDDDRISIVYSKSGDPRILYKKEDGEEIYIHSYVDPVNCANWAIDLLGRMEKEGIAVLFGFGLGYFAEEVLGRFEKGHVLMVYEATPSLFKAALKTRDLSELLASDKIHIILGEYADNFTYLSINRMLIANGKFWVVKHHPSIKLNEEAYERFFKRLKEEKMNVDMNTNTGINMGKEFTNKYMTNIPILLRKQGVSKLKGIFKGRPAVIVSAGPSLDKNMQLLKKVKGKAVIIAVDAAIPTLLPCNIIPDVIVGIDPLGKIATMYRDIPLLKHVPLICLSQYQTDVLKTYPGPVFINSMPQSIGHQWFSGYWEDKGFIGCAGGSVAFLAFGAAEMFAVDTIAIIGQDLSFAERSHTRGFADISDKLNADELEKGLIDVHSEMRGTFPTENIFGETVLTRSDLLTFQSAFKNVIKDFKGTVINATEGGLPLDGAVPMRFMDFIDEYCEEATEIDTFSILSDLQDNDVSYNLDGLITMVTAMRTKFMEIKQTSKKISKHTKTLQNLRKKGHEDSADLHNILNKVETLIEKVKDPVLDFIASTNYKFEIYLQKQEVTEIDDIEDKLERLDKQLERGKKYYSEIIKSTEPVKKELDKLFNALKREENINLILNDKSIDRRETFLKVGRIYKKAGMAAQAVKYLELAVNSLDELEQKEPAVVTLTEINKKYIPLAEAYMEQFRFDEATDILEKIMNRDPDGMQTKVKEKVSSMLKTCNRKMTAWREREKKMGNLLKEAEENYGSHLESGYFYFRIKDLKMAEKAYVKAIETSDQKSLVEAHYGLAHTYLAMEDHEKAVGALEKAIEIDPANPILYRDLGFVAYGNNDIASAEIFFVKAIELAPNAAELYKPLADLYMGIEEKEKAVALYENALQANPTDPVIQQELGALLGDVIAGTESSLKKLFH